MIAFGAVTSTGIRNNVYLDLPFSFIGTGSGGLG